MQRRPIHSKRILCASIAAASLALSAGAHAAEASDSPDPYMKPDDSYISIGGTVESVARDSFVLDYGGGVVRVEMDDHDRDADAYKLLEGDKVTVSGRIDDDFFESTKIEASTVYVENLGTTFFASWLDEESGATIDLGAIPPVLVSQAIVRGTVTEVNDEEFLIDTGTRMLRVDTERLEYDPLDEEGYLQIEQGDRVKVIGQMDLNMFTGHELVADSVVKLYQS